MKVLVVLAIVASAAWASHIHPVPSGGGIYDPHFGQPIVDSDPDEDSWRLRLEPGPVLIDDTPLVHDKSGESDEVNQSAEENVNLGEAIGIYVNEIRRAMPCGNKEIGLPKLAPLRYENISINIDDEELKVHGSVDNIMISGINKFEFVGRSYDPSNNFFTYDMIFPELSVLGEYDIDTWFRMAGWPVSFAGKGLIDVKVVDFRMVGHFAVTPIKNGSKLDSVDFKMYVGDVIVNNWNNLWPASVNKFVNHFEGALELMLSEQLRDLPAALFNEKILPHINEVMSEVTVPDLIKMMMKIANTLKKGKCEGSH